MMVLSSTIISHWILHFLMAKWPSWIRAVNLAFGRGSHRWAGTWKWRYDRTRSPLELAGYHVAGTTKKQQSISVGLDDFESKMMLFPISMRFLPQLDEAQVIEAVGAGRCKEQVAGSHWAHGGGFSGCWMDLNGGTRKNTIPPISWTIISLHPWNSCNQQVNPNKYWVDLLPRALWDVVTWLPTVCRGGSWSWAEGADRRAGRVPTQLAAGSSIWAAHNFTVLKESADPEFLQEWFDMVPAAYHVTCDISCFCFCQCCARIALTKSSSSVNAQTVNKLSMMKWQVLLVEISRSSTSLPSASCSAGEVVAARLAWMPALATQLLLGPRVSGADRIPARKLGKPKDIPKTIVVTICGEQFWSIWSKEV